jgi:hypothetical protein
MLGSFFPGLSVSDSHQKWNSSDSNAGLKFTSPKEAVEKVKKIKSPFRDRIIIVKVDSSSKNEFIIRDPTNLPLTKFRDNTPFSKSSRYLNFSFNNGCEATFQIQRCATNSDNDLFVIKVSCLTE